MAILLNKGTNCNLTKENPLLDSLKVCLGWEAASTSFDLDASAFLVKANGKVRSDADFCFYNVPEAGNGSVKHLGDNKTGGTGGTCDNEVILVKLSDVPTDVDKICFTVTINNGESLRQNFSQVSNAFIRILDATNDTEIARFNLSQNGSTETAMIFAEVYRNNGDWKFKAIEQGFAGGLGPLATFFGVDVGSDEPEVAPIPVLPPKLSLVKLMEKEAPALVDLAKKATISLQKNKLTGVVARVGVVIDASGSMLGWTGGGQYGKGHVQQAFNMICPLAAHFDDDQSFEAWAYSGKPFPLPSVTLANYSNFINTANGGYKKWSEHGMFGGNNEVAMMRAIIEYYKGTTLPVFIVFITDGGVGNASEIKKLLIESSSMPIFWQFAGIGGSGYGVLEELDTMPGRVVDNAGFFKLESINQLPEEQVYDKLLGEFPLWIKAAKEKGILPA